ncbi:MAG: DNA-binding protein [Thiothrix sp.]|uniref:helix-turn-helix transcriptional regulator n=1 Tax=Thiothrix sp. TaxID=1032 RepID=UPI002625E01A|nr:DNA-binding protein [Thiothrix sp.]MDD5395352.1 DNA-binding protein [Thiothrix sp.]
MSNKEYEFTLKFSLPDADVDPETYVSQLGGAGCDDAIIGIGQKGKIALQFNREADNAYNAVLSAIRDVKSVIPTARLIEAIPDLVGLSDIADLMGFSRQNMRKLMLSHSMTFPDPVHTGASAIWHLSNVLQWFESKQNKRIADSIKEIAETNLQVNLVKETERLDVTFQARFSSFAR